jgi:hypothetical protein
MFERLLDRAAQLSETAARRAIKRLGTRQPPDGVTIMSDDAAIRMSGKQLRRQMIDNPLLRNLWR